MSPFAALGLDEDADERAVKRAYALRLRATRPDEDPEGFQTLNAAYKAALAAIRWRAQAAEADADETEEAGPPAQPEGQPRDHSAAPLVRDEAPLAPPRSDAPPLVPDAPPANAAPLDVPDDLFDYTAPRDDGGISFDLDAFLADLLAVTADPAVDLQAWLSARMAGWPLAMKPTLAPYVLAALADDDFIVSPDNLATIIAAFGLDDVLSGVDPLTVEQLRRAAPQRWTRHEGAARARYLLARENRKELSSRVRVAGWPPLVAPAIARMLTGRYAARWTALRWLPFPPMARLVMKLLRYISAGAVDMLAPPIDPIVLARWQWAERTVGRIRFGHLVLAAVAIPFLAGIVQGIMEDSSPSPEQRAGNRISAIWNEEGPTPQKAVDDYTAFIASYPAPPTDDIADDVATAMFNRGIVLGKMGRMDEAARSYQALDDTFGGSQVTSIRHLVAGGLNNWAYILGQRKDYRAELPIVRKVVARYPRADDEEQGNQSFDVQVAKALINEADALEHLGDRDGTLDACRDLLSRFPHPRTDQMTKLRATALDIMHDYDSVGTIAPGQAPFSLLVGRPAGGPATPKLDMPKLDRPKLDRPSSTCRRSVCRRTELFRRPTRPLESDASSGR